MSHSSWLARGFRFASAAGAGLLLALAISEAQADPKPGKVTFTPTVDPEGQVSDQAPTTGGTYKIRDSRGHVVAEGPIGRANDSGDYQPTTVELPAGDYSVDVHMTGGQKHDEGTNAYKGSTKIFTVKPGQSVGHEVEMDPRDPIEHVEDQIEYWEDVLREHEKEMDFVAAHIRHHEQNGEQDAADAERAGIGKKNQERWRELMDKIDKLMLERRKLAWERAQKAKPATTLPPSVTKPNVHIEMPRTQVPVRPQKPPGRY